MLTSEMTASRTPRHALWSLGFRPFFLLAAIYAALGILLWVAQLSGSTGERVYLAGPLWHAHEMLFGYAFAVIVGFLFTAVRNWTGQPTPTGGALSFIVGLWLAARVMVLTSHYQLAAIADAAFAFVAAAGIAAPLYRGANRRNYFFVALVAALGGANLWFYLAMHGADYAAVKRGLALGLDIVLFAMVVIGGRVIPMFTASAVAGATPRRLVWLERLAVGSVLALLALDAAGVSGRALALVAGIAAAAHGVRLALWQPWLTLRRPILWILHASYAWIAIYLVLRAAAEAELVSASAAFHALTVGAIGGLTLGMMTRVARGHTGRPLVAGVPEVLAYALVQLAAVARVFVVPLAGPQWHLPALVASGLLWSAAFALYVVAFGPILVRPRADRREG